METISDSRLLKDHEREDAHSHVPQQTLNARLAEAARLFRSKPFRPHPLARNAHAQTLAAALRPSRYRAPAPEFDADEMVLVEVEPGVRVQLKCLWQERRESAPTIVLVHGLEGSSESPYMRSTARKAHGRGFNVARLNMRNCGGTEHLTHTLYNSGMTGDLDRALSHLAALNPASPLFLAGFSMSGNMALRLAGDYSDGAPRVLAGVCAVSPSIELAGCARYIERRANALYRTSFMRSLRRRVRKKRERHPALYDTRGLWRVRTVRQFDERYTAPHGGYRDADDYYARSSSLPVLGDIRVPTLILHAEDDPIIPATPFRSPGIIRNPHVLLVLTERGGHVGFIANTDGDADRFWAENRLIEFCSLLYKERNGGGDGGDAA